MILFQTLNYVLKNCIFIDGVLKSLFVLDFYSKVYYGEYKCSGPGANFTGRVPWARMLRDEEAQPFIGTQFVDGDAWLIRP